MTSQRRNGGVETGRRGFMKMTAGAGLAAAYIPKFAGAQGAPSLGMVSFPAGNSAHSKIWIKHNKFDAKHNWNLDWQIRNTVESYYGDFNNGVYGGLDLAGLNVLANLYNRGVPFKIVAASLSSLVTLITAKGAKISSPADLKGKRIATDRTSFYFAYLRAYLRAHGIDVEKDMEFTNVNLLQLIPRFQRGDFDAAVIQPETAIQQLVNAAPDKFEVFEEIGTAFARTIGAQRTYQFMAVRTDWLGRNPGVIERVIASYQDMSAYVKANAAEATALLEPAPDKGGAGLPRDIGMAVYGTGIKNGLTHTWTGVPVGGLKQQIMAELAVYKDFGFIEKVPDDGFFYAG